MNSYNPKDDEQRELIKKYASTAKKISEEEWQRFENIGPHWTKTQRGWVRTCPWDHRSSTRSLDELTIYAQQGGEQLSLEEGAQTEHTFCKPARS